MKKRICIFIISVLALSFSKAQVPADSLPGEYVGISYFKSPTSDPWTISIDTLFVRGIDSINCVDTLTLANQPAPPWFPTTWGIMHTVYSFCNNPTPASSYTLFYSGDSIRCVYNNIPQPYPNPNYSWQFYGKRISNKTAGINVLEYNMQINIYPNPFTGRLNFKLPEKLPDVSLYFYDVYSRLLTYINIISGDEFTLYMKLLPKGIYFYRLTSKNNIVKTGKVIKD